MEQEQFIQDVLPLREPLLAYAKRMQGGEEDAEDVVQEVYMKLWDMRRELPRYRSIRALALQMTKHLCINRLRLRERYGEALEEWMREGESLSPHKQLEQKDQMEHLGRMIESLPAVQQAVLRMKHLDGLEVEEIAQLTGSAPEAIRANLSRARKKVKAFFFKIER
ncbi:MAG: sigma-70 family RNA polymerase sigma factor [Tannerellaceae bacterium]|jgi:RNA polymerase sigma-70 factor (ECF subfamily)|nr:sigma-70 family RNA polymerase sigma factor [Tannerellaceae bacterium]